ncbi:hypothetical protein M0802_016602 [Mischocyttarus mexicanus]|nr:hypothetical protein M0802_016602 [Mischocyttarus mexicanus]
MRNFQLSIHQCESQQNLVTGYVDTKCSLRKTSREGYENGLIYTPVRQSKPKQCRCQGESKTERLVGRAYAVKAPAVRILVKIGRN